MSIRRAYKPFIAVMAGAAMIVGAASPVAAATWDITDGDLIVKDSGGNTEFTIDLSQTGGPCPSDPPVIDLTLDDPDPGDIDVSFTMDGNFTPNNGTNWYRAETTAVGSGTYTGSLPGPVPWTATMTGPGGGNIAVSFYEINGPDHPTNPCEDIDTGLDCFWSFASVAASGNYTGNATPPPGQVQNMSGTSSTVSVPFCAATPLSAVNGGTVELSGIAATAS